MLFNLDAKNRIYTSAPIVVFCIFLFGFLLSFFGVADRALSNQFMVSVAVLFLIYPIHRYQIDIDRIVKRSGMWLSVFTGVFFLAVVTFPGNPISNVLTFIFDNYSAGSYGLRDFSEEATLSFHIGTVPFLYLPFALFFLSYLKDKKRKNILGMLVIFPAIVASASRGLWMVSLISLIVIYFLNLRLSTKIIFVLISIPIVVSVFGYLIANTVLFSSGEESNSVKIGHITSFFDQLDWTNFFIGNGLASFYYSSGSGVMKAHTEVTPLDMLRYFGFILTPILYTAIFFPIKNLRAYIGENRFYTLIFVLYLINSFTNPIMFNSYGLLTVLWYWSKILNSEKPLQPGSDSNIDVWKPVVI
ncbi:hypothetical protein WAE58_24590 [Pedobacter panaciterrae]|uniref:Oligosaccharide repeat unit polymerase n=1 Tax=Pedobacter panaciterrae TaxID=363849 RepID=A0ABU8NTP5_9SPHI